jgi:2-isopropylmalate synthase
MSRRIEIYDTTLRDGAQSPRVFFSEAGKLQIARRFDAFGMDYIEGGFPASNPKDAGFFQEAARMSWTTSRVVAFGSTRRARMSVGEDPGLRVLLETPVPAVAIFGKAWRLHVRDVLKTTDAENLRMVSDSVRALKAAGREVVFDAEHFFDGYRDNAAYAMAVLDAAREAGADVLVLCDTNGGSLPDAVAQITREVVQRFGGRIGIHAHNDGELAVANTLAAVQAGAVHVQGTINGFGERCGNANLCSIIPNLVLKMGLDCTAARSLKELRALSELVYELADIPPNPRLPFVGDDAFAHKAGMHADAVRKNPRAYEHILPESVGNQRRILVSELSGASNVLMKAIEMGLHLDRDSKEVRDILRELERLERQGYQFEAADASFKLLVQKVLRKHRAFFHLDGFRVIVEKRRAGEPCVSEATVKLRVNDELVHTVGEGDGPVDALNRALRKALIPFYPSIREVRLVDYSVRILDAKADTAAKTRVLIESAAGRDHWNTMGVSDNIIEASWDALVEGIEYKLLLDEQEGKTSSPALSSEKTAEHLSES